MRNHLLTGTADKTQRLLELAGERFLLIDDGPVAEAFLRRRSVRLFDIHEHSFNPLRRIDYRRAREFAEALYTASPEGRDTLTVRNGKRALARLLLDHPTRLDRLPVAADDPGLIEAHATIDDLLLSPVLRRVLCRPTNFSFKGGVVARLDRAELGDFDAFVLAALLVGQHQGPIIIPDFGFYGRDFHSRLIRQNRLIAAVTFLAELSPPLQQLVLSIRDKTVYRTTREDAERLIFYVNPTGNPATLTEQAEGESKTT